VTRRLVAAFVLGAICSGTPLGLLLLGQEDRIRGDLYAECDAEVAALVAICNARLEDRTLEADRSYCRLREAEVLLQPHYPDWPGFFAERDRRRYDVEIDCSGPDMAPAEWTTEELASNRELGAR
jgi:hypothetical protein